MSTSMDLIKPLVTLVAIVNPLAIVPFFIHYTQGYSDAQAAADLEAPVSYTHLTLPTKA